MRLFFSLPLPPSALEALRAVLGSVRAAHERGISFGKVDQLHFTLAFLGEQPETRLDAASAAGVEAARGVAGFELAIGGAGAFPSRGRPRVLWLGVPTGGPPLVEIATRVRQRLARRGFALEERPFRAHLTIARVRPGGERDARRALASLPSGELASFRADGISLVHSILGAGGAQHRVLRSFRFEG